jgi:hypothetical protein
MVNQPENIVVWTANRDNPPVSSNATLNLTIDGDLLLRNDQGEESLIADLSSEDSDPVRSASMLDSGNFVLYNNSYSVIWGSFDSPTDTILGGQNLYNNLVSSVSRSDHSSGRFYLTMQGDGNLVSYPVSNTVGSENAYWYSEIYYSSDLSLNKRGRLSLTRGDSSIYILANDSYPAKKETTPIIYRAILDSDGILKLYSHHFLGNTSSRMSLVWSAFRDQCQVKGFCGFNSYCIGTGSKAECHCYPGFGFINPRNQLSGCYNNFSRDPMIPYDITPLPNI